MKEDYDGAEPSPNSYAIMNLLKLSQMTGNQKWKDQAKRILKVFENTLSKHPSVMPHMCAALDFYLATPKQIVIAGNPQNNDTREFLKIVHKAFIPNKVIINADGGEAQHKLVELGLSFLEEVKPVDGKATAYICQNFTCQLPINDAEQLKGALTT